jgi:5-methylcytosine-specific restriction enzyme subunit McrC
VIAKPVTIVELTEYKPKPLAQSDLPEILGIKLFQEHQKRIEVEFPSPKTSFQWRLTSLGWVGAIPLSAELTLMLKPKVPLGNLFRMLEYAYRLDFKLLDGLLQCESLTEFYERLANVLAKRILDRERMGLHRSYVSREELLPCIRGRLDVASSVRNPWRVELDCKFEEHTADITDNQILSWTLRMILQSGLCSERIRPTVRQAYRGLQGAAMLTPISSSSCINRLYHRLNADYEPLHALCRFFLEHSGPSHQTGNHDMLPFLVDMARLFELFVAEWLKQNLPEQFELLVQHNVSVGESDQLNYQIDLVLRDRDTGKALCVLDTKYKSTDSPANDDVNQVVTYAELQGCHKAVLLYPSPLAKVSTLKVGRFNVGCFAFNLNGDLEAAGKLLLKQILSFSQP